MTVLFMWMLLDMVEREIDSDIEKAKSSAGELKTEGFEMIETHDLFLRALAVPVEKKKKEDQGWRKARELR